MGAGDPGEGDRWRTSKSWEIRKTKRWISEALPNGSQSYGKGVEGTGGIPSGKAIKTEEVSFVLFLK